MRMTTTTRHVGFVTIVDISGRIVLGEESTSLVKLVSVRQGTQQDSAESCRCQSHRHTGLAYLISSLTSVRKRQGELKLLNPTKEVQAVMQLTKLLAVFDIRDDEAAAVRSFGQSATATA